LRSTQSQIRELFAQTLDLEEPARDDYLDRCCGTDLKLRAEVESLLRAAGHEDCFLRSPLVRANFDLKSIITEIGPPTRLPNETGASTATSNRGWFWWVALAVSFSFLTFFVSAGLRVAHYGHQSRWPGWSAQRAGGNWIVSAVEKNGPVATQLQIGDRIVALNGDSRVGEIGPDLLLPYVDTGRKYTLVVLRGLQRHQFETIVATRSDPTNIQRAWAYFILGIAFYLMALFMGLYQPRQWITRLGFVAGLAVSMRLIAAALAPYRGLGSDLDFAITRVLRLENPWHLALTYHFFYLFFAAALASRVWRVVMWALYLACGIFSVVLLVFTVQTGRGLENFATFAANHLEFMGIYKALFQS
jgi:hypothetical protein